MHSTGAEQSTLVEVLQTAFEGESNVQARYREFAEKADGEGWHGVASLFRAAARAEEIHAANHGRIARQLGGHVEYLPHFVEVKNTLENLRSAVEGERFEVDTRYPAFVVQAELHHDVAAIRTFTWALEAEKTHVRLFLEAEALVEVEDEDAWVTMHRDFFVCPVCGYTSEEENEADLCPVCNCAWKRFECVR
ncbi:MAG TPA: ferritin family protein [Terracidiphilus sp.]|nr:ferritin family protein [Terracidiphilus sp.]